MSSSAEDILFKVLNRFADWILSLREEPAQQSSSPAPVAPACKVRVPLAPPQAISFNGIPYDQLRRRGVQDELDYLNQAIKAAEARHREERAAGPDSDETWTASQQVNRLYAQLALLRPVQERYQRRSS